MSEYIINEDILNFGKAVLPLVSFVIPYYKPSINYIKEMLDSILPVALKYGNSEILLHNDGTNDASISALVTEYAERYPKLFRLSEIFPNCGISLSRQILVERAHGKYLLSFDADDVMLAFDLVLN